jgi:hypothetical protein
LLAAGVFNLPQLASIAQNVLDGNAELNPSITTWLHDRNGEVARELLFNQATLADVTLQVEDETIEAHKSLLAARCEVLQAMFGRGFAEGVFYSPLVICLSVRQGVVASGACVFKRPQRRPCGSW